MSLRNGQIIAILVCLPRRELLPLASAIRPFLKLIRIYYPEKFIKRLENWLSIVQLFDTLVQNLFKCQKNI